MQSALNAREILALSSWRTFQQNEQNRPKSTLTREESKGLSENVFASAVLHGNQSLQHPKAQSENRLHRLSQQLQLEETFNLYRDHSSEKNGLSTSGANTKTPKGRNSKPSRSRSPSRRRHAETKEGPTLRDEDYIKNTMEIPTAADYPDVPPELFQNPKVGVHNALQSIADFRPQLISIRGNALRCTLRCRVRSTAAIKVDTEVVVGEGMNKVNNVILMNGIPANLVQKSAEAAAYTQLLARYHALGLINSLFAKAQKLPDSVRAEEKDTKIDIYNYAARFNCVPKFSERVLERQRQRYRGPGKKLVEINIELSEQNISVIGRGPDLLSAEVSAGLRFKQEAEIYNAQRGGASIIIRDSTALTNLNCKKFFEYYKVVHPKAWIEVKHEQLPNKGLGIQSNKAWVTIDGQPVGEPVEMPSKVKAEELAYLTAAVSFKKEHPELFPAFFRALQLGNGNILQPLATGEMRLDEDSVYLMRRTLDHIHEAWPPSKLNEVTTDETTAESGRTPRNLKPLSLDAAKIRDIAMKEAHHAYLRDPKLEQLRNKRSELPMSRYTGKVIDLVTNNSYSIIIGATGSGKTTQVPQILLEEAIVKGKGSACNIICTQPRRIAATSVARRVAQERAERLQETVGYHVRFDVKVPRNSGSITFCTVGILLRQLQHSPDEIMDQVSYLLIDEVHERDILTDFLLVSLKKAMTRRAARGQSTPKVVLMSATIDTDLFANYFETGSAEKGWKACPTLSVPGRTFPVKEKFLDGLLEELKSSYPASSLGLLTRDVATKDYLACSDDLCRGQTSVDGTDGNDTHPVNDFIIDWKQERKISADGMVIMNPKDAALVPNGLVAITVAHIAKTTDGGAVLVFLPGLDEITKVEKFLAEKPLGVDFGDISKFKVSILHSSIPAGQTEVFNPVPEGCRKVILATNIAETSITIPDVQYVVDTGKLREKQYDQVRRITHLQCTWISKSSSKQRAGRAGRVQNGNYFALFPKARYNSMRAIGLPEMLRSDLQEICLDIKTQAFKNPIREFLEECIEPPPSAAVDASMENLVALGALTESEQLTSLGKVLASLPVHPSLGKMIVLGVIFRCLDPMVIIGAAANERQMFVAPPELRQQAQKAKRALSEGTSSDHIAMLNAFKQMRSWQSRHGDGAMMKFGHENFIHVGAFRTIYSTALQIEEILIEAGLIPFTPPLATRSEKLFGGPSLNTNSSKIPLIKALNLAGLHPNLAVATGGRTFRTPGEKNAMLHPSSINAERNNGGEAVDKGTLYSYSSMARSNDGRSIFLRDTTESTPLMSALFGGSILNPYSNLVEMDGWLPWYVKSPAPGAARTLVAFRQTLEQILSGAFADLAIQRHDRHRAEANTGESAFLADGKGRAFFGDRLADLLDRTEDCRGMMKYNYTKHTQQSRSSSPGLATDADRRTGNRYDRDNGLGFYNDLMSNRGSFRKESTKTRVTPKFWRPE